jgi:Flp pilus assembly protein TadD
LICLAILHVNVHTQAYQDIEGMASYIFVQHPNNPPADQDGSKTVRKFSTEVESREKDQSVEDALALGNSARDDIPPRYADADRAYRLASRLDPKDPRPYIGLANILYDQSRFREAAKMYQRALDLVSSGRWPKAKANGERQVSIFRNGVVIASADWHGYLGNSLLRDRNLIEAEAQFLLAVENAPKVDKWYALLAYTYLLERKFAAARNAIEAAIRLAPQNESYKELLKIASRGAP